MCWKNSYVLSLCITKTQVEMKDLRPISILPTLSKIMERVLGWQPKGFINAKSILPVVHSHQINRELSCRKNTSNVCKGENILTKKGVVPQGSILVLLLFSKYTSNLIRCLQTTTPHMYANDTQMYICF